MARVVLDARARTDFSEHLEVVGGAHAQPLRFEQLAVLFEPGETLDELSFDAFDRAAHVLARRHVVRRREQHETVDLFGDLTGERVDPRDALDFVAEQLDASRPFFVRGEHLDGVAPDAELVAGEREVVALVGELDEATQDRPLVVVGADVDDQALALVFLGRTEAVDRRDRRDNDHIAPGHDGARGGVPKPVDLVVDRRVLLDVRVGRRQVRLGLVVVVVGDEVLDPVLREELPELTRQLRREALVGRQHDRWPVHLRDCGRDRERLPGPGDPEQGLELVAAVQPLRERVDRRGLVARRPEGRDQLQCRHRGDGTGDL